jgi:hypothetical protein
MRLFWSRKYFIGAVVLIVLVGIILYLLTLHTTSVKSQPGVAATSVTLSQATASSSSQPYWIWLDSDLTHLLSAGFPQQELQYFFNNSHTLIIDSGGNGNEAVIADLPKAMLIQKFDTEAELEQAINTNTLYPNVTYVGYDATFWAWVRRNVTSAQALNQIVQAGAATAHKHGLKLFYEIPEIVAPQFTQTSSGDKFTDFLNENLAGQGSAISDLFEIETQSLQGDDASFDSFATKSIAQARAGHPTVPVLLGLTTYDANAPKTEQGMVDAYTETKGIADGYWINGVNSNPAPAVEFLEQLYTTQTSK